MRVGSQKKLYHVVVVFPNGMTRTVKVKAVSREIAEKRALKFQPNAIGVERES